MNWQTFGRQLILSNDLDPVYNTIYDAKLPGGTLAKFCLAYWMFYDMGTASRIAEDENFWDGCQFAYYEKWPRGSERRHYRGEQCLASIKDLRGCAWDLSSHKDEDPVRIVDWLIGCDTFSEVQLRVQTLRGFGPWITWKIADMLERVIQVTINFEDASLMMYSEPVAGAALILGVDKKQIDSSAMSKVLQLMQSEFGELLAPPRFDRKVNIQEFETIFCKNHSYHKGSYHVGHDITTIRRSLIRVKSDLAQHLLKFVPPEVNAGKRLF